MNDRLERQIAFLNEADRLKSVVRGTTLCDASRYENSAEHSWHLTLYALVLADQAGPEVDISLVIRMLILRWWNMMRFVISSDTLAFATLWQVSHERPKFAMPARITKIGGVVRV